MSRSGRAVRLVFFLKAGLLCTFECVTGKLYAIPSGPAFSYHLCGEPLHLPRFRFVFAGGGPRRAGLEAFCRENFVSNVEFLPYQDAERMAAHLAACHIGLVTQIPETLGCVVPSKTYSLMAAGRPILFIGPPESTPARIIDRFDCGWHLPPGNPEPLIDLLHLLADHPELVQAAGRRARQAYEQHFTKQIAVAKIAQILQTAGAVEPESVRE